MASKKKAKVKHTEMKKRKKKTTGKAKKRNRAVFPPSPSKFGRPLQFDEVMLLKKAFGTELDVTKIRVFEKDIFTVGEKLEKGEYSRVAGNEIHLSKDPLDWSDEKERKHFLHEAAHVWQYQQKGWSYAYKSIWAQATLGIEESKDYDELLKQGIPIRPMESRGAGSKNRGPGRIAVDICIAT